MERNYKHRGGRPNARAKSKMHELYGYVCHICGHEGAGEADHLIPLKVWPDQPVDPELRRPAHGSNYPCIAPSCMARTGRPRCCNQERGVKPLNQMSAPLKTSQDW